MEFISRQFDQKQLFDECVAKYGNFVAVIHRQIGQDANPTPAGWIFAQETGAFTNGVPTVIETWVTVSPAGMPILQQHVFVPINMDNGSRAQEQSN